MTPATISDIERILRDDYVNDDETITVNSTALTRYMSVTKNNEMLWFPPVIGKPFKLSKNIVVFNLPAEEQKLTEDQKISEDKIVRNVPKESKVKPSN